MPLKLAGSALARSGGPLVLAAPQSPVLQQSLIWYWLRILVALGFAIAIMICPGLVFCKVHGWSDSSLSSLPVAPCKVTRQPAMQPC